MIGYFKPCFAEWRSFPRVRNFAQLTAGTCVDATSIVVDFFCKMLLLYAEQFNMQGFLLLIGCIPEQRIKRHT